MDAVTYPTPEVIQLLADRFVCYSVNVGEPTRDDKELMRQHRLLWSPGFVLFEPRGAELRRFVGYRAVKEFLGELNLVLGLNDILRREFDVAAEEFSTAARSFGEGEGAPEALFWHAIAVYQAEGDKDVLRANWDQMRDRFPTSSWASRADVWEFVPSGRRGVAT